MKNKYPYSPCIIWQSIYDYEYIPTGYHFIKPDEIAWGTDDESKDMNSIDGWWKIKIASYPYFNDDMKLFVADTHWNQSFLDKATTVLPSHKLRK